MDPKAMEPHGAALRAYFEGDASAELIIRRDDGQESRIHVSHFFRGPAAFTSIEKTALAQCRGHVADVGAGTGSPGDTSERSVCSLNMRASQVPIVAGCR